MMLNTHLNWLNFHTLERGLLVILIDYMIFSVTSLRCDKDVCVNSFFPCKARLWNSLSIEYFPLTYDLNDLKSRINRHLLSVVSF